MLEEHKKLNLKLKNPKLLTQGGSVKQDNVTKFFLVYKILIGAYFVVGFGIYLYLHGYVQNTIGITMIFLTHWCHKLMSLSFVYNSILVVVRFIQENREKRADDNFFEKNGVLTKISWAMSTAANNLAITVTVLYWSVLYDPNRKGTPLQVYENYDTHLIQTVVTLLDIVISERPWRLCHAVYPELFALVYLVVNVIYVVVSGDYIYPMMDWNNAPGTAVLWIILFIVTIVVSQAFLCLFAFIRGKFFEHLRDKFCDGIETENFAKTSITDESSYDK